MGTLVRTSKFLSAARDINGIVTITMRRPPLNRMNLEFMSEFSNVLRDLERDNCPGAILTSYSNKVFSAGFDIGELCNPEPERFNDFYTEVQNNWTQLYGSTFPTVAVINGHAMAAGCLLALSCDYRVMIKNRTIGYNEMQMGLATPTWFTATMLNTVGHRHTELGVTLGKMFTTDEALNINLIDCVADSKEEGIQKALSFLEKFTHFLPKSYTFAKHSLRGPFIKQLKENQNEETQLAFRFLKDPEVIKKLEIVKDKEQTQFLTSKVA
ncbi:hypothetical protein RI129_008675 [Pyrocoelia pectoralis]|uniref:Enoyl-CoA delta isomerase 1, mitochondrial n=1 Tax=Pyrocoelia pectoralis TaxID=417401 RepID=A0AAN7V916_9COLE